MSLWVLDTDMLTLWLRGQETVARRVAATPPHQLAVTIITVEEILGGWYTQIRQARDDQQLARAYQALQQAVEFTRGIFRARGEIVDVFPAEHAELALRITLFDDEIESLEMFDPMDEGLQCLIIFQIANMMADERITTACQAESIFQLCTAGQYWTPKLKRRLDWRRCIPTRAA